MINFSRISTIVLVSAALTFSCSKKSDNPSEILAGNTSKTWKIARQVDANGDKEKLSDKEKEEKLNLYADGKFSIVSEKGTATGTWAVQGEKEARTFVMQFENQPVTENFSLKELENDKVVLKAGDGSEMVLKEE